MGTRADFFIGIGPNAEWIGSTSYDGHPESLGLRPLQATSEIEFRAEVKQLLDDPERLTTRPDEGWPWPWRDFRTSDYGYAWDPARGVAVVSMGRQWVTNKERLENPERMYESEKLLDAEVPDMSKRDKADVLAKSGLVLLGAFVK